MSRTTSWIVKHVAAPWSLVVICSVVFVMTPASAQQAIGDDDQPATTESPAEVPTESPAPEAVYGPEVVAKADSILDEVGLKRIGKTIVATGTSELSRAMTLLARARRDLRLLHSKWQEVADVDAALRRALDQLNVQDTALNLQLARINPTSVTQQNKLVAQINANRAATRTQVVNREKLKEELDVRRAALNDAEATYAETVLAIRKDYAALRESLSESLTDRKVKIAFAVMETNFDTPDELTADKILAPVERRLAKIEQEVFSELIRLEVVGNGSLLVPVSVGNKTARMVVDSGSTLVSLPAKTAEELDINVPSDAPRIQLVLADGRTIPAQAITLDRVRVGQFEAENVAAAVLDRAAISAEPLLGMSFLGNFKFEINTADKTLKMLRVATD